MVGLRETREAMYVWERWCLVVLERREEFVALVEIKKMKTSPS